MFDCPVCEGGGCRHCDGAGRFDLDECPMIFPGGDVWEAIEFAALYKRGLPPVAGGALDQSRVFVQACRFIWAEQQFWRTKLGHFGE